MDVTTTISISVPVNARQFALVELPSLECLDCGSCVDLHQLSCSTPEQVIVNCPQCAWWCIVLEDDSLLCELPRPETLASLIFAALRAAAAGCQATPVRAMAS